VVLEQYLWLTLDVGPHMLELAVQIVQLKHEEVGLVLIQVVLWHQVNRQIELVLDLHNVVQI